MRQSTGTALALLLLPAALTGQQLRAEPRLPGALFIRHQVRLEVRTEAGGQLHASPESLPGIYVVDSIRPLETARRIYTRSLHVDADGRGIGTSAVALPLVPSLRDTAALLRLGRLQLILPAEAGAVFPEQVLATPFRVLPAELPPGKPLTEAVSWQAERAGVRAAEQGTRVTVLLRDTVVDGQILWVLRDSAGVAREDAWPTQSVGTAEGMTYLWRAAGVRTGVWLYDPQQALTRSRTDTLRLEGELTRTESSGQRLATRRRVVHVSTWTTYTAEEYQRLRAAQLAESRRTAGGMVPVPTTPLQQRLFDGDTAALDSLVAVWRGSDAEARAALERQLLIWWRRLPEVRQRRLLHAALAVGDTVAAFEQASSVLGYSRTLPRAELLFLLPWLENAARAFRSALPVETTFSRIFDKLARRPAVLYGDSANACGEGACALLERYADRTDVDPRLRDMGLIAAYYRDPPANFPRLEARAAEGTPLLHLVILQAQGIRIEWSNPGRGRPVPPAGSEWSAWNAWAGGRVGENTDFDVLRLYRLRTGRDLAHEFRTGYRQAQTDSARYTFGMLLRGLEPGAFSEQDVIALLESGSTQLMALGRSALNPIAARAGPAPSDVAEPLLDGLIGMFFLRESPPWASPGPRAGAGGARTGVVLVTDSLPAAVLARWRDRVTMLTDAEWRARDPRAGGFAYRFTVRQSGAFAVLTYTTSQHMQVEPSAAPRHEASGGTIIVLRTGTGWKQVSHIQWTT